MKNTHLITLVAFLLTAQATTAQAFNVGDRVQANGGYTIRTSAAGASTGYTTVSGTKGTILAGPTYAALSGVYYYWYNVNWDSGQDGWSIEASMTLLASTPTITSISPNPVTGSNSGQTLTVYGSGFVSGAQVKLAWPPSGSATLSATFISSSQLQVTATFGNDPSSWTAQVINPGSVTSSTYGFTVQAPTPVIQSLSQYSASAGGSAFTLTVNGVTFNQSSIVRWNGANLTTTPVVSGGGLTTALNAQVPASDIASAGTATVTVYNPSPGGGTSSGVSFTINSVSPTITSVSPNPVTGSNSGQTLNVYGSGFVSGAQVKLTWPPSGSATLSATFISSSQLQVSATFGNDPSSWTAQVINPGSVTSSAYGFTVQAPVPVIQSLSPNSAAAGGSAFALTVNGSTFDQGSVVRWNGVNLTTTPTVSGGGLTTALTAQVPASDIASAGTATVTVYNPSPGGGTSAAVTFTINSVGPTISSVSPNPVTGSNSGQTLTVYGSGFVSGAQVKLTWPPSGSATLSATFISSSQLQVSATFGNDPSSWTAQVINPGSVTSSAYGFTVQAPVPVIQSLSPSSATTGGSAFTLTVNGSTFDQGSVVRWNGVNLTTTPTVSGGGLTTALNAQVPASDIASAGTATVTVYNPSPGGGTSAGATFTINASTSTRAFGVDISHVRGTIDWTKVFYDEQKFAIIKATDGYRASQTQLMFTDPCFSTYIPAAKQAGLIVGAYHFARPYINSAKDEADFFLSVAGNYVGAGYLPPALDIEDPEDDPPHNQVSNMTAAALSQWIREWCAEIETVKHVKPMLYMTPWFTRNLIESDIAQYPLWIAYYENPPDVNPLPLGPWGTSWTFLQYSEVGHIIDDAVQNPPELLDVYNGDLVALNAFVNGGTTGDNTPPTINAFNVSPSSTTLGQGFTVSYTVSDAGGSHLKQVTLWRANVDGTVNDPSWAQIGSTIPLSGDGPSSGSFPTDIPSAAGNYWYGIHVNDNANNYMNERVAGLGPKEVTVTSIDTTPDPFTFTAQTGVALNTTVTSNTITVSGINSAASITITGGTYSINSGSYTSSAGTVNNGNTVTVRQTSSGSYSSTTNATLTIGGVNGTFSVTTQSAPVDTTPDPFTFTAQTGVALNTTVTSNTITVSGINAATSITITGGTYSINGGSYTSSAGTVNNGNTVTVRQTSSGSYSSTTNATLTIGGVNGTFSVTTQSAPVDTTPDPFTFTAQTGVALNTTVTSNTITVSGINSAASITITGGTYSINGGAYTSSAGTVNNGNTVAIRQTSSSSYSSSTNATLTIGGVSGTFSVTTQNTPPETRPMTVDLNHDGLPNFYDFSVFASFWRNASCSPPNWCNGSDFDKSGIVDIHDLKIFADLWLWPVADVDMDKKVDFADYTTFASHWTEQNCTEPDWCDGTDFDHSGSVDIFDLATFARYWLEGL